MTFSIFFRHLIFPIFICQRLRRIYNPGEQLQWSFFAFFFKIHKKTTVQESLFNKIAGLYPAASLKERTPKQVFSDEFYEILKTEHLQATASVLPKNVLPIK